MTVAVVTRGARILGERFFDLLFPLTCLGCGAEGSWLCKPCMRTLPLLPPRACAHCGAEALRGNACRACTERRHPHVSELIIALYYDHPLAKKIIRQFKYDGVRGLRLPFAELIVNAMRGIPLPTDTVLCPMPMPSRRRRVRGYNHAELLAKTLGQMLNYPVVPLLRRIGNPKPQAGFDATKRHTNAAGTFALRQTPQTKNIILIDDVVTTGATMEAAAECFAPSGCRVYGLGVAAG
ncbi:MAG: double zinc ribbon domain-containing protein [bacterium]|nr:double zinc ribbon domain-containing protein [bacterium]